MPLQEVVPVREERWGDRPRSATIRRLLRLTDAEVEALAPEILAYHHRPRSIAGASPGI